MVQKNIENGNEYDNVNEPYGKGVEGGLVKYKQSHVFSRTKTLKGP